MGDRGGGAVMDEGEGEGPKSLREAWELNDRRLAEDCIRRGVPVAKPPWPSRMAWAMGARALLEVLKRTDPDRLLAAIWRAERDLDELARAATSDMIEELGTRGAIDLILGRPDRGDGDSLDVRPPTGRGR